jgi:hypothetical protein
MTGRDRMVVIAVVVLVALAAAWMLVVSPERKKAGELGTKVAAAQTQLATAESAVSSARAAQSQYAAAYASIVNLGKAVPPSEEVPALIDQLAQASSQRSINFTSINSSGTPGAAAATPAASTPSAATAALAPTPVPFSFVFEGSYFDLEHLFNRLTDFATLTPSGELQVSGRLLTIQSLDLSLGSAAEGGKGPTNLTGSITATAYVMPASQGVAPAGGSTAPGTASPASSTGSAPTSPAVVKVNP